MTADEFRTLYKYNAWANRRITGASRPLDPDAFTRNLGDSLGSIRNTLVHVMWAEAIWLQRWQGRSPQERPVNEDFPDTAAIEKSWRDIEHGQQAFLRVLTDDALAKRIGYVNFAGQTWEYSLGQMLHHVANHSTYHRGQVVTMLRQLGQKAPSTDYLLYFDELA